MIQRRGSPYSHKRVNGFRTLCSFFLFLAALAGGAPCQNRSELRISTRDQICEYELSKKVSFNFIKHYSAMVIFEILMIFNYFKNFG